MKDSYSFDRDEAGLDVSFDRHRGRVQADVRPLRSRRVRRRGGVRDHGRDGVARLPRADELGRERAHALRERRLLRRHRDRAWDPSSAGVPGTSRCAGGGRDAGRGDDRGARRLPAASTPRRRPRRCRSSSATAGARARPRRRPPERGEADDASSSPRSGRLPERRSATRSARTAARSGRSASPSNVIADEALREGQFVAGANRDGWHVRGVEAGRDYEPRFADIRQATRGRRVPGVRWTTRRAARDRGRPHLQARHVPLERARGHVPRRGRAQRRRCVMGSYGIGPGRRDGGHRRAAPRRARDRVAPIGRSVRRPHRRACPAWRSRRRRSSSVSRQPAPLSCSTTASSVPARSSPTPISSAAPFASPSARRRSRTARWMCSYGRLARSSEFGWKR